jgi:hypothetical protein
LGCGSQKYAPVSGKVTLNGKVLPNAVVVFNRIPSEGSIESGPSAIGLTDENGVYTLRVNSRQSGALIGKHKVAITLMSSGGGDSDAPAPPGSGPRNIIPKNYNVETVLSCEVPAGGNDHANFDLRSP